MLNYHKKSQNEILIERLYLAIVENRKYMATAGNRIFIDYLKNNE